MKIYNVKFKYWWWWHFNPLTYILYFFYRHIIFFHGKGMAYLTESSLILKGPCPKFYIPIFAFLYHRLLCNQKIQTIPYSVIEKYKPPIFIRRFHTVVFRQPNGKKRMVVFRIKRDLGLQFTQNLIEYLTTVHSLTTGQKSFQIA